MAMFNSHVKLPEGNLGKFDHDLTSRRNPGIMVRIREIIPFYGLNHGFVTHLLTIVNLRWVQTNLLVFWYQWENLLAS